MVDHVSGGPGGPPLCYNDFHDLREGITANIHCIKGFQNFRRFFFFFGGGGSALKYLIS